MDAIVMKLILMESVLSHLVNSVNVNFLAKQLRIMPLKSCACSKPFVIVNSQNRRPYMIKLTNIRTIRARGRNGEFIARRAIVVSYQNRVTRVSLYSKDLARTKTAPVIIEGSTRDLFKLFTAINNTLVSILSDVNNDDASERINIDEGK